MSLAASKRSTTSASAAEAEQATPRRPGQRMGQRFRRGLGQGRSWAEEATLALAMASMDGVEKLTVSAGLGPADKGVVQVRGQHCTAAPHLFPFPKSRVAATSFTERHLLAVWKQTGQCRSSKCSKCKSHTKAQSAISNCETNTFQS